MSLWIGIDPGYKFCGIILRDARELLAHITLTRAEDETTIGVGPRWFDEITYAIDVQQRAAARAMTEHGRAWGGVAIEGVTAACGFRDGKKQFAKPEHLMGLAATWGAVVARYPDITSVPPGGNGAGMLAGYPEQLVTAGERRVGLNRQARKKSKPSHCRSAWDCALRGEQIAREVA